MPEGDSVASRVVIVPTAARDVVAAAGALLLLATWRSVVGTIVVPRMVPSALARMSDHATAWAFHLATDRVGDPRRRDRMLAAQAPATLIAQLGTWLGCYLLAFVALTWPFTAGGLGAAFADTGAAMSTLGATGTLGSPSQALSDLAAVSTLVTVALQIGYLPVIYGAFNRRETEVTLLYARAGLPAWGPELLIRTHFGFASGESTLQTLPELYARWERWAADVAESHVTYLPLNRFRSPQPLASRVTSLLAVLDSAALLLSIAPSRAPVVPARLCLRMGFTCFAEIARALGADLPDDPAQAPGITLSFAEFTEALRLLEQVDFPIERPAEQAWADFVGWRVNYERAAYAVARAVDAPPALWSGPRRRALVPVPPRRPAVSWMGQDG